MSIRRLERDARAKPRPYGAGGIVNLRHTYQGSDHGEAGKLANLTVATGLKGPSESGVESSVGAERNLSAELVLERSQGDSRLEGSAAT